MQGSRVAIAGIGNGAISLVQGPAYDEGRDDDAFADLVQHKFEDGGRGKLVVRTDLDGRGHDV